MGERFRRRHRIDRQPQRAGVHVHGAAGQDAERDRAILQEAGGSRDRPVAATGNQHIDVVALRGSDQPFAQLWPARQVDRNLMAGIGEGGDHLLGDLARIAAPQCAGMDVHHDVDAHSVPRHRRTPTSREFVVRCFRKKDGDKLVPIGQSIKPWVKPDNIML